MWALQSSILTSVYWLFKKDCISLAETWTSCDSLGRIWDDHLLKNIHLFLFPFKGQARTGNVTALSSILNTWGGGGWRGTNKKCVRLIRLHTSFKRKAVSSLTVTLHKFKCLPVNRAYPLQDVMSPNSRKRFLPWRSTWSRVNTLS